MKTNILLSTGKVVIATITKIGERITVTGESAELTEAEVKECDEALQAVLRTMGFNPKCMGISEHDDAEGAQRAARQFLGGGKG